jgi:hypothetical protein
MATCKEIMDATKNIYPSSMHPGWDDLSPPVRFSNGGNGKPQKLGYMLNKQTQQIMLVGESNPQPIEFLQVSERQGRLMQIEIPDELLDKLENLLNRVADERKPDPLFGPGENSPTPNAVDARELLDKLGMERHRKSVEV